MIMNRVGDFGFFLGILTTFFVFQSLDFYIVFLLTPFMKDKTILFCNVDVNALELIAFLFFIGSVGKSAQVGLHT